MDRTTIPPAESRGEILTSATPRPASAAQVSPWLPCAAAGVITLTALAAYCNSFQGPFIFDVASFATTVNEQTENIGARRLHTILEKVLDELSFEAPDLKKKNVKVDAAYVTKQLSEIVKNQDLSRYIL